MLEHPGYEGVGAVAVGRKAEGCQLFGGGEPVSMGRGTAWLQITRTRIPVRSTCWLWPIHGVGCKCVGCLGGEERHGKGGQVAAGSAPAGCPA